MKLNRTTLAAAIVSLMVTFTGGANAGPINNAGQPWRCLCAPASLGQSFTAEDEFVSLTVFGGDANAHLGSTLQFTLDFRAGHGSSGALLASYVLNPTPGGFNEAFTFDLSSIPLTVGEQYSFILTSANRRGSIQISQSQSTYAGGRAFDGFTGADFGTTDMGFIVTPVSPQADVPEPTSLALIGLGLGLAGISTRRRQLAQRSAA